MNSKKIICTVTNDLCNDRRMHRISIALSEFGYDVTLVGRLLPNSKSFSPTAYKAHRIRCTFHKGMLFYIEYNFRLFFWLRKQKADLLNAIDLDTILPAYFLHKFHKTPFVYDAHEYFSEVPELVNRPLKKRIWEWVAQLCIPKAKAAYTVAPKLAEVLTERYKIPFGVVRNVPFYISEEPKTPPFSPFILMYQGAINDGRGLEAMIDTMRMLPEDIHFHIAGEGDLSEKIRTLSEDLVQQGRVRFLGMLSPEALTKATQEAHVGINLLENKGLNYYLSLANKTFDYIQAGKPAIHIQFPEYVSLMQEFGVGILVEDLQPEKIKKAILTLQNEKLYLSLSNNCREAAKVLNWEREKKELFKIIEKST